MIYSVLDDYPRSEWERLIDEWILNERDRAMLKRKLLDGVCYERLAEEFGLSPVQTQRRIKKARTQLFSHI